MHTNLKYLITLQQTNKILKICNMFIQLYASMEQAILTNPAKESATVAHNNNIGMYFTFYRNEINK